VRDSHARLNVEEIGQTGRLYLAPPSLSGASRNLLLCFFGTAEAVPLPVEIKSKSKTSGQVCPLHTSKVPALSLQGTERQGRGTRIKQSSGEEFL